jgi:CheY-like chemotaxis protein
VKTVLLFQWKALEAEPRLEALRAAGFNARHAAPDGQAGVRALREHLPDVFVIDLTRNPSNGAGVATLLRGYSGTRGIPLIFAGGETAKKDRVRALFPDATYCGWRGIAKAIDRAMKNVPAEPRAPDMMAGYSGTPLARKLGIKENSVVLLAGAPDAFERLLYPLPAGARVRRVPGEAQRVLLFVKSRADLARAFDAAALSVSDGGGLWIVWPKRASGIRTDISENEVRAWGLERGWVDYKICAVDQTWSGLLFARRKKNRKYRN